jgi:cytochrome c5
MPRHLFPLIIASAVIAACAPSFEKGAPAVTPRMAARSGVSEGTLQLGRAAYLAHCGRCHEYQLPDSVSDEDWHVVVPGMAWNAGLNKSDEVAIRQYLIAAKAKK